MERVPKELWMPDKVIEAMDNAACLFTDDYDRPAPTLEQQLEFVRVTELMHCRMLLDDIAESLRDISRHV